MALSLKPAGIISIGEFPADLTPDAQPGEVQLTVAVGNIHISMLVAAEVMQDPARDADVLQRYFVPVLATLRSTGAFGK
jgi:hypothetical protein